MKVYQASYCVIEHPDISFSREKLDFGKGFYVTESANLFFESNLFGSDSHFC